jgi:hypothetical protein
MAEAKNKTRKTEASVEKFLSGLDGERQEDCRKLAAMLKRVTKAEPKMWGANIVGFGEHRLKYESGRELDWFLVGFSPRKAALTLYGTGAAKLDAATAKRLGKHEAGGGCLYIRRLADVDGKVLEEIVRDSVGRLRAKGKA